MRNFVSNVSHKLFFVPMLASFYLCSPLHAYAEAPYSAVCENRYWRPVVALGAGYISTSQLGSSAYFPIVDPVVDSFYSYTPNGGRSSTAFVDGFVGIEIGFGQTGAGLQLGVGYSQSVPITVKGTLVQGTFSTQGTYSYEYNVSLKQLMVEGKLFIGLARIYHPYVFGGYGKAFNRAYDFSTTVPPFLTFTRDYDAETNTTNTYAYGAGLDIDLDEVFRVGIGYRYTKFGKVGLGDASIDGTPVSGTLSQDNLSANEFFVQLTAGF